MRVLVEYESSTRGRAALEHAVRLARQDGAALTVVSVVREERVDVGCMRCRASAALWNSEMRSIAREELDEAASLTGDYPTVDYVVACGRPKEALAEAASRCEADVIVVPWHRVGRLHRLGSAGVAEHLRRDERWNVVVAPAQAPDESAPSACPASARVSSSREWMSSFR